MFAIFGGFYYWFEKMWGVRYNEALGRDHFWITFVGVNIIFFPQHFSACRACRAARWTIPPASTFGTTSRRSATSSP